MIGINKQCMLIFVLAILLTINATTPNATIPNEAEGSTDNNNKYIDTVPSKESIKELKKVCETSDGDWINGECTFVTQKGDDRYNDATADKEAFEHNMADKDLLNVYREQQEEIDQEEVKERGEEITENDDGSFSTTLRQQDSSNDDDDDDDNNDNGGGKDEDNDGREDSNGEEWENNDYKDDEGDDD